MDLIFEVIEGPRIGQKFRLANGQTVGRLEGDITLHDKKVSSRHAHIEVNERLQLVLVDDDSSNGIRINGRKVKRVVLRQGVQIHLGTTVLRVSKAELDQIDENAPKDYKGILKKAFVEESFHFHTETKVLSAFDPPLKLHFIQGIQDGTIWTLGYGPRKIGSRSLDLPIHERGAPETCFEIRPTPKGPELKTNHVGKILVNDNVVSSEILSDGDRISIGDTLIKVEFFYI